MPKETRVNRFSTNCSRSSPYPSCSNDPKHVEFDFELGSLEDIKQWEEARCPICLDHPHNAVLLLCSSFQNGCRPYVCNTSVRHSNCLDQFWKLPASSLSAMGLPETRPTTGRTRGGRTLQEVNRANESELLPKLHCPLCRGEIQEFSVVQAARKFMNSKSRNCSCETCDFVGNYAELRRHARSEHPFVRPSEADPERKQNWERMVRQRNLADLISISLDHSQNNLENQAGFEELSVDGIEEVVLSMNEVEEQAGLLILQPLRYQLIVNSVPIAFAITMNTVNGEDNLRRNISSRTNILPASTGNIDNTRFADAVRSLIRRRPSERQVYVAALWRPPVTTTRQTLPDSSGLLRQDYLAALWRPPVTTTRQTLADSNVPNNNSH